MSAAVRRTGLVILLAVLEAVERINGLLCANLNDTLCEGDLFNDTATCQQDLLLTLFVLHNDVQ